MIIRYTRKFALLCNFTDQFIFETFFYPSASPLFYFFFIFRTYPPYYVLYCPRNKETLILYHEGYEKCVTLLKNFPVIVIPMHMVQYIRIL